MSDLLSEIKELINLEVEWATKKQNEEFKFAKDKLQERVTNLEHAHVDLEQYVCQLCVRVEDVLVTSDETANKVHRKVKNILKEVCPSLSGDVIDPPHCIESN